MLVIVCGLSGSGKTHLIESAGLSGSGIRHLKASDVLREAGLAVRGLSFEAAYENQECIALKMSNMPKASRIVLDGHLLIETEEGPLLVPDVMILGSRVRGIVFVKTDPRTILNRKPRPSSVSPQDIDDLSQLEQVHARRIARKLSVPFEIFEDGNSNNLKGLIVKFFTLAEKDSH